MKSVPFRQVYVLMLGLLVALGMNISVVQASNMAAGMTMSGQQMSASGMGDCGSCKSTPGGEKIGVCAVPVNATVPQFLALLIQPRADRPLFQSAILSGWTASPNPHPPKSVALV